MDFADKAYFKIKNNFKMKRLIIGVLLCIICITPLSCKGSHNEIEKVESDTIILKENIVVFISPSDNATESSWYAILYDNNQKKYKIINLLDFKKEYTNFYQSAHNTKSSQYYENIIEKVKEDMNNKKYTLEFEKKCDLNNDHLEDEILLFSGDDQDSDIEVSDSPLYVFIKKNDGSYALKKNSDLIYTYIPDNSLLDNNLVIKDNYFTVEQTTGGGNNKQTQYITFKYNTNGEVILHKVSTITTTANSSTTKIKTTKDFGIIKFENVTEDFLTKIFNK